MATLSSLQKQIDALQRKADAIRKAETAEAIKKVKQLIAQYGLTAQDVGLDGRAGRGKPTAQSMAAGAAKSTGVARYSDPQSGKTWTGRGKPPNWIAGAADRTKFLIDGGGDALAESSAATAKPTAKKAAPTKSGGGQAAHAGNQSVRAAKKAAAAPKGSRRSAKKADSAKVQEQPEKAAAPNEGV